jgi:2-desacetyl-2-hydroxyethyl bacteriochlorophyllide A dehydrogenase
LPNKLSSAHTALAEPVAVAVHTVRRSRLKVGDQAVILGAGPIGLLIAMIAKRVGAKKVMISDISSYRLTKAKELGFVQINATKKDVVKEVRVLTDDVGAGVVFEVAGNQITAKQMIETSRIQGEVVVVSVYKNALEVDLAAMHFKEISLTTTRCYTREDFQTAIDLLASGEIAADALISHRLPLEDIQLEFEFMQRPDESLKILFEPNGEENE